MTPRELIDKYGITLATELRGGKFVPTGKLCISNGAAAKKSGDFGAIVAAKAEILAVLTAEREAADAAGRERAAKIAAIPGLAEIRAARADAEKWRQDFGSSFEGCDVGGRVGRPMPQYDFEAMEAAYPRAVAYLVAEQYAMADNDVKAAAGQKALDAIIDGADYKAAIDQMEAEWSAYCMARLWD